MSQNIELNKKEALRYLGYHNQVLDDNTKALLDAAAEDCIRTAKPKYIWQLYKLTDMALYRSARASVLRSLADMKLLVQGQADNKPIAGEMPSAAALLHCDNFAADAELTLPGKNIAHNLKEAQYVVLFSATLGIEMDRLISITEHRSMTKALMQDACASAYIETICDLCNDEVKAVFAMLGYKALPRFSPGYGDLPIALQSKFCQLLDTHRKIGLSCSSNNLLIPRKSVTAIIGLAPGMDTGMDTGRREGAPAPAGTVSANEKALHPCSICQFQKNCQHRNCIREV